MRPRHTESRWQISRSGIQMHPVCCRKRRSPATPMGNITPVQTKTPSRLRSSRFRPTGSTGQRSHHQHHHTTHRRDGQTQRERGPRVNTAGRGQPRARATDVQSLTLVLLTALALGCACMHMLRCAQANARARGGITNGQLTAEAQSSAQAPGSLAVSSAFRASSTRRPVARARHPRAAHERRDAAATLRC